MATATIRIRTKSHPTNGQLIEIAYETGDFAVHPTLLIDPESESAPRWTVTHVPTGLALTYYCMSEVAARELADFIKDAFARHKVDTSITDKVEFLSSPGLYKARDVIQPRLDKLQREFLLGL